MQFARITTHIKLKLRLLVLILLFLIANPQSANAITITDYNEDVPKAAEYLSGKLIQGENNWYNKFNDPNSEDIPKIIKDNLYIGLWNPKTNPNSYVQCVMFVNAVLKWQYPNFPTIRADASSFLDPNTVKKDSFNIYKNNEEKSPPRPGDILVWNSHVATIVKVEEQYYYPKNFQKTKAGVVYYYESNTPQKYDWRNFYYNKENKIVFYDPKTNKDVNTGRYIEVKDTYNLVPSGWVHWKDINSLKQKIIGTVVGCPQFDKDKPRGKGFLQGLTQLRDKLNTSFGFECEVDSTAVFSGIGGGESNTQVQQSVNRISAASCEGLKFSFIPPEGYSVKEVSGQCPNSSTPKTYTYYDLKKLDNNEYRVIEIVETVIGIGREAPLGSNEREEDFKIADYKGKLLISKMDEKLTSDMIDEAKKYKDDPKYSSMSEWDKKLLEESLKTGRQTILSAGFYPFEYEIKSSNSKTMYFPTFSFISNVLNENYISDFKNLLSTVELHSDDTLPVGMDKPGLTLTPPAGSKSGKNACTDPKEGDIVYTNDFYEKEDKQYLGDHGKEAKITAFYGVGILEVDFTKDGFHTPADCRGFLYK